MKNILITALLLFAVHLSAVHDLTINGGEEAWISVDDSISIEFYFEAPGAGADFEIAIQVAGFDLPAYSSNDQPITDGGPMDTTGEDGYFLGGISNFISLPEEAAIIVTLTDNGVSDSATLHFEQLDTSYSVSGSVLQEGDWFDWPVPGALVYTFYNTDWAEIGDLLANFNLEAFLAFMAEDRYLLSDMTGLLGDYQVYVPDTQPDAPCIVGVYSMLDLNGEFVAPDRQSVTVNGHLQDIDFLYLNPDGILNGTVTNEDAVPVSNAMVTIAPQDDPGDFSFAMTDSLGTFAFALLDGIYTLNVQHIAYQGHEETVTIAGSDVDLTIVLLDGQDGVFSGVITDPDEIPLENALITVYDPENPVDFQIAFSDSLGDFEVPVLNGFWEYSVVHEGFEPAEGSFTMESVDVWRHIILTPVGNPATEDGLPAPLTTMSVAPNPFNPETTVHFELAYATTVRLDVFNIRGQRVMTPVQERFDAGSHRVVWNAAELSGGIYLMRLQTGYGEPVVQKVVLLK